MRGTVQTSLAYLVAVVLLAGCVQDPLSHAPSQGGDRGESPCLEYACRAAGLAERLPELVRLYRNAIIAKKNEEMTSAQARDAVLPLTREVTGIEQNLSTMNPPSSWVKFHNRFSQAVGHLVDSMEDFGRGYSSLNYDLENVVELHDSATWQAKKISSDARFRYLGPTCPRGGLDYANGCFHVSTRNNRTEATRVTVEIKAAGWSSGADGPRVLIPNETWSHDETRFGCELTIKNESNVLNVTVIVGPDGNPEWARVVTIPCSAENGQWIHVLAVGRGGVSTHRVPRWD